MARTPAALTIALVVLLAAPAGATANQRFAKPGGSGTACASGQECDVYEAFSAADPGDEVILEPGDYGEAGAPLTTPILATDSGLNIHGVAGQPRPRFFMATAGDTGAFTVDGAGSTVRHILVEQGAGAGLRTGALVLSSSEAHDVVVRNFGFQGKACVPENTSLITDAVCISTGQDGFGVATWVGSFPQAANASTLRNVTAIDTNTGGTGIADQPGTSAGQDQHLTVSNSIARGQPGHADVAAMNYMGAPATADITIDHSAFGYESWGYPGAPDTVIDAGGNVRNAPALIAADGWHQLAGSPTIDAGVTSAQNGPSDPDGDPRLLGFGIDIGADERVPRPAATTGRADHVTTTAATLHGFVNPRRVATTYRFQFGRTKSYGRHTADKSAGAGFKAVAAAAQINGLTPNTRYHFRLVATNRAGTTRGADRTFVTLPKGPPKLQSLVLDPDVFPVSKGSTVRFALNKSGKVQFTVHRIRPDGAVRIGGFSVPGKRGKNHFHFTGRVDGKALAKGRYRLTAKTTGNSKRAGFRISAS